MHYKDLTPYEYYLPSKLTNVLNIGWLEKNQSYSTGNTPKEFLEKLNKIIAVEKVGFDGCVNQIRGTHPCNLCEAHKFYNPLVGSCELWIPSKEPGIFFAAPSLIVHYIQEHNYCPPKSFIESVLRIDLEGDFNGQKLYDDLVSSI